MNNSNVNTAKILHIISSGTVGGAERCFLEMLEASKTLGYDTAAVCAGGGELQKLASDVCGRVYTAPMADNADLISLYKLYRIITEYKPDLCHLHMNRATLLGALAARFAGVKSLGSIQGEVRPLYAYFPDYLTFCSKSVAEHVRTKSSVVAARPSFYLYNCVDGAALAKDAADAGGRAFLTKEFGVPEKAFVICQVARLHPNKGHIFLIDAVRENIERIPNLYCLIVGGGDKKYEDGLRKAAADRRISDRVIFTGTRLDVAKILGAADLFVLPSLQEGIPMTIMEALSLKVPVAVFDVGGIRELCEGCGDAQSRIEFVAPRDTKALAAKIYDMYLNYPRYKAAAEKASEHISCRYGKSSYFRDIGAIYKDVMRSKHR